MARRRRDENDHRAAASHVGGSIGCQHQPDDRRSGRADRDADAELGRAPP
jgi:hypothetical protein